MYATLPSRTPYGAAIAISLALSGGCLGSAAPVAAPDGGAPATAPEDAGAASRPLPDQPPSDPMSPQPSRPRAEGAAAPEAAGARDDQPTGAPDSGTDSTPAPAPDGGVGDPAPAQESEALPPARPPLTTEMGDCQGIEANAQRVVNGSGRVVTRTLSVPSTPRIHVRGILRATITVDPRIGDEIELEVRSDDNVAPLVTAALEGGVLQVGLADAVLCNPSELSLMATVGPLTELATGDAVAASVHNLDGPEVTLKASGASRIRAEGAAEHWALQAGGKGEINVSGSATAVSLNGEGASRIVATAPDFTTRTADVSLSGSASAALCAENQVTGRVSFPASLLLACDGASTVDGPVTRR